MNSVSKIKLLIGIIVMGFLLAECKDKKNGQSGQDVIESKVFPDSVWFEYEEITGIGYEKEVSRRDPSDVIKVGDKYYVWYTKIPSMTNGKKTPLYPSGYYGTIWYASSSNGGHSWQEQGEALGLGEKGAFDSHAVFTPNILVDNGKYYLFYTGVKPTSGNPENEFEGNSKTDITAIGVVVADNLDGPFIRISNNPVLTVSADLAAFDSYRVDDAALLVRDGKIWLYYKGRSRIHGKKGPALTQMGVAFAEEPEGPFEKNKGPLLDKSHEVLIWNHKGGVASLASRSRSIYYSHDGLNFSVTHEKLVDRPKAPGLSRPHLENDHANNKIPGWGVSQADKNGSVYLIRFEMKNIGTAFDFWNPHK